jgi:hypothetical protein
MSSDTAAEQGFARLTRETMRRIDQHFEADPSKAYSGQDAEGQSLAVTWLRFG